MYLIGDMTRGGVLDINVMMGLGASSHAGDANTHSPSTEVRKLITQQKLSMHFTCCEVVFWVLCVYVCVVTCECKFPRTLEDGARSFGTEVTCRWESPAMDIENPTWVLSKRSMGFYPLNHLSAPCYGFVRINLLAM